MVWKHYIHVLPEGPTGTFPVPQILKSYISESDQIQGKDSMLQVWMFDL